MCGDDMKQPMVNKTSYHKPNIQRDTIEFEALNRREAAKDEEIINMANLSSDKMPFVTNRAPRETVETLTTPNGVFSNGLKLATIDGTNFKYDGVTKGTVTSGIKSMVNMNGNIVIFPDKKYYDYVNDVFGSFTSPDIDYVCEWNNRLWGVANGDPYIYATVQGDFKDWSTKNDEVMDSYFVDTGGNANFKGITSYHGHVTAFKDDQFFEVYGNMPSNFQVVSGTRDGLLNHLAITEVDSVLYFLADNGPLAYTGGLPEDVGFKLNDRFESGVFGTDNQKLYACLYDGGTYSLYVYDPRFRAWHIEDDVNVVQFAYHLGSLYALLDTGALVKFRSGSEVVEWSFETKHFDERSFDKKEYHSVSLKMRLEPGTSVDISTKIDEGAYELQKTVTYANSTVKEVLIPINLKKCNRFQLKVEGTGGFTLYHIQRRFTLGSRLGG